MEVDPGRYNVIWKAAEHLAQQIRLLCHDSPEKREAERLLQECLLKAGRATIRNSPK